MSPLPDARSRGLMIEAGALGVLLGRRGYSLGSSVGVGGSKTSEDCQVFQRIGQFRGTNQARGAGLVLDLFRFQKRDSYKKTREVVSFYVGKSK